MATTTSARASDVVLSVATSSVRRRSLLRNSSGSAGLRTRVYCSASSSNADWSSEVNPQDGDKNTGESRSSQPRYSRYSKPPSRRLKDSSKLPFPPGGGIFRLPSLDFPSPSSSVDPSTSSSSPSPFFADENPAATANHQSRHFDPSNSSTEPQRLPPPSSNSDSTRHWVEPQHSLSSSSHLESTKPSMESQRSISHFTSESPAPRYYSKPYRRVRANLPLGAHQLPDLDSIPSPPSSSSTNTAAANPPSRHLQPPSSTIEQSRKGWRQQSSLDQQARNHLDDFSPSSLLMTGAQGRHLQPGEQIVDGIKPASSLVGEPLDGSSYSRYTKSHQLATEKLPLGVHHLGRVESSERLDFPRNSSSPFSKEEAIANPPERHLQSSASAEHLKQYSPSSSLPSSEDQTGAVSQAEQPQNWSPSSFGATEPSVQMPRQKTRDSSELPKHGSKFRSYGTNASSVSTSSTTQNRHFHSSPQNYTDATSPSQSSSVSGGQPPWSMEQLENPPSSSEHEEAAADFQGRHLTSPPWATKHLEDQRAAPRVLPPNMAHLGRKHLELPTSRNPNRLDASMYGPQRLQERSTEPPAYELPFEFQYTYSEVPKAEPIAERGPQFSPFGPDSMPRPWCGKAPTKSKKPQKVIDSFNPPPDKKGMKPVQGAGPFPPGQRPVLALNREDVMGDPLSREEIAELVDACRKENRQLNIGRDGVTHNMLDVIHNYWKRRRVIKIKCKGVPTIDIENVCFHLEDKTGGKIIFRHGGTMFLFRGRNYNPRFRPHIPLMLWKPPVPIYAPLVQHVPEGLTYHQAELLRKRGRLVKPLKRLLRNGVYLNLADEVKEAFEIDELVKLDCRRMNPSDIRKIGAKMKEILGIVILSFQDEQVLMWRGPPKPTEDEKALQKFISDSANDGLEDAEEETSDEVEGEPASPTPAQVRAAQDLDALWQRAVDFGMVTTLSDEQLDPDTVKAIAGTPVKLKRAEEESDNEEETEKEKEEEPQVRVIEKDERVIQQAYKTLERKLSTSVKPPPVGVLPVDELAKLLASPS